MGVGVFLWARYPWIPQHTHMRRTFSLHRAVGGTTAWLQQGDSYSEEEPESRHVEPNRRSERARESERRM